MKNPNNKVAMPPKIQRLISLLTLIVLYNCNSASYVWQGRAKQPIVLAAADSPCKVEYEKRIWSALFGGWPLNTLDEREYFKDENSAYTIAQEMRWSDLAYTVFGGWLLSITSRTWVVKTCKNNYNIKSQDVLAREREKALEAIARSSGNPIIVYSINGESYKGHLLEINEQYWVLEVEQDTPQKKVPQDVLELKGGKKVYGKVLSQSRNSVRFKSVIGTKRYLKSSIAKLRFNSKEEPEKIKKKIPIEKGQIEKVYFKYQ